MISHDTASFCPSHFFILSMVFPSVYVFSFHLTPFAFLRGIFILPVALVVGNSRLIMYSLYITSFWGVIPDMKFVFVPDSFKGTLSSLQVIEILEKAAKQHFEDLQVIKVPIADGGEGTVEALITALGGEYRYAEVTGPIEGMTVRARYGISENRTAIIEMAQASGLPLLNENQRNPLLTTTYGTGELIRAALDEGIREFIIGIGGSATNDGGMGMAQALGIAFMDGVGKNVGFGGRYLSEVRQIVIDGLDPRIRESSITVICDVNNPLTGPRGATYIYGPQKGATEEMLKTLENGMKNYARVIQNQLGIDVDKIPGAGAGQAGSRPYRFPRCCSEAGYRCHTGVH